MPSLVTLPSAVLKESLAQKCISSWNTVSVLPTSKALCLFKYLLPSLSINAGVSFTFFLVEFGNISLYFSSYLSFDSISNIIHHIYIIIF